MPELRSVRLADRAGRLRGGVDLLVVTVTEVERNAVLDRLGPWRGKKTLLQGAVDRATYYLGALGPHGVALTMCRMGSVGIGASHIAVANACTLWAPRAVVMVGIAFGKDPEKQRVGDVLVASQIISYEEQRVGVRTEFRGPAAEASGTLLDRFRNVVGWRFPRDDGTSCAYKVGPILSGEKLVDDADFKAALFAQFPHALGGEMEGRGLYAAAGDAKVDWILVKGICDWGDGKKHDGDQPLAAAAAVDLMCAALGSDGALDGLEKAAGGAVVGKKASTAKKAPTAKKAQPRGVAKTGGEAPVEVEAGTPVPPPVVAPTAPSLPSASADARFTEFLANIEADVAGKLGRMPKLVTDLARALGLAAGTGESLAHALIHDKTGKEAVVALKAADAAIERDTARVEDRRALQDILLRVLPFATDWRPLVQRGRAALDTGARFVDLPLGTPTMAEAILAGIDCRPCRFVTDSRAGPAGAALIRKPVAGEAFLDPTGKRLAETTVGLLAVQLLDLAPDAPELRAYARLRKRVDETLQYYCDPGAGDDYLPRWVLLDDPLLAQVGECARSDEDHRVPTAVAVLGKELPHLRVVRMGVEADGETFLALHVGGMWRKRL